MAQKCDNEVPKTAHKKPFRSVATEIINVKEFQFSSQPLVGMTPSRCTADGSETAPPETMKKFTTFSRDISFTSGDLGNGNLSQLPFFLE